MDYKWRERRRILKDGEKKNKKGEKGEGYQEMERRLGKIGRKIRRERKEVLWMDHQTLTPPHHTGFSYTDTAEGNQE